MFRPKQKGSTKCSASVVALPPLGVATSSTATTSTATSAIPCTCQRSSGTLKGGKAGRRRAVSLVPSSILTSSQSSSSSGGTQQQRPRGHAFRQALGDRPTPEALIGALRQAALERAVVLDHTAEVQALLAGTERSGGHTSAVATASQVAPAPAVQHPETSPNALLHHAVTSRNAPMLDSLLADSSVGLPLCVHMLRFLLKYRDTASALCFVKAVVRRHPAAPTLLAAEDVLPAFQTSGRPPGLLFDDCDALRPRRGSDDDSSGPDWSGYTLAQWLLSYGAPVPHSAFFPPRGAAAVGREAHLSAAEVGFECLSHHSRMQAVYYRAAEARRRRTLKLLLYVRGKVTWEVRGGGRHAFSATLPLELLQEVVAFVVQ